MIVRLRSWWQWRQTRKGGWELLHHARHVRHMREDVAAPALAARLREAEQGMLAAIRGKSRENVEKAYGSLISAVQEVVPARSYAGLRENLEILLVAVAVAMAFRTYFIQPFKIPTGSMQPTLYGIHYRAQEGRKFSDQMPLSLIKVAIMGEWYQEFRAQTFGQLHGPLDERNGRLLYAVGGLTHAIPRDLPLRCASGEDVVKGQVLASGIRISGDHIFVNKVAWNLRLPVRGEVMVFSTDKIPLLQEMKTHYIKRMVGLPGETISIAPPRLVVNDTPVESPASIRRVERDPRYAGYQFADRGHPYLGGRADVLALSPTEYLAFGDNTTNSFDSRYWGPVPRANLVGPAFMVYWPFSPRWGLVVR